MHVPLYNGILEQRISLIEFSFNIDRVRTNSQSLNPDIVPYSFSMCANYSFGKISKVYHYFPQTHNHPSIESEHERDPTWREKNKPEFIGLYF